MVKSWKYRIRKGTKSYKKGQFIYLQKYAHQKFPDYSIKLLKAEGLEIFISSSEKQQLPIQILTSEKTTN